MFEPQFIFLVFCCFLFSGFVKGVVGLGLPTVSLGLMVTFTDLTTAIALLILPSLITNLWQALSGGALKSLLTRFWPFYFSAIILIFSGVALASHLASGLLIACLGIVLILYSATAFVGYVPVISSSKITVGGIVAGSVNGILTGLTGSFTVPGVMYLQSIGLSKDQLVQAMGLLFLFSTIGLALSHGGRGSLSTTLVFASSASVVPAVFGMKFGQRFRGLLPEDVFKKVLLSALLFLGFYLAITGVLVKQAPV